MLQTQATQEGRLSMFSKTPNKNSSCLTLSQPSKKWMNLEIHSSYQAGGEEQHENRETMGRVQVPEPVHCCWGGQV